MTKAFRKSIIRTFKNGFGRFIAVVAIVTLGIGIFTGGTIVIPSMVESARNYTEEQRLFDLRLISTLGFTKEDIALINQLDNVKLAAGSHTVDFIYLDEMINEQVLRVYSICQDINMLTLEAGRLPVNPNEIVLDSDHFSRIMVGQEIRILNFEEISIQEETFIVTGLVRSPLYMSTQRGVTSMGAGGVSGFGYLVPEAFTRELYSQVYLYIESQYRAFSKEYDYEVTRIKGEIEEQVLLLIESRANVELSYRQGEIERAKEELEEKLAQVEEDLGTALGQVDENEEDLLTVREELEATREELEERYEELEEAKRNLETARRNYRIGRDDYTEERRVYDEAVAEFQGQYAEFVASRRQFEEQRDTYRAQVDGGMAPDSYVERRIEYYEGRFAEAATAFATHRGELDTIGARLTQRLAELNEAGDSFDEIQEQIEHGEEELEEALALLEEREREIFGHENRLEESRVDIEERIIAFQEEIAIANEQLLEMELILENLGEVQLFVLDRQTNIGYVQFEVEMSILGVLAIIFSVLILIIATLSASNKITKFINKESSSIGIYRGLGYGRGAITAKYVICFGIAIIIGGVIGTLVGIFALPQGLWLAYSTTYGFAQHLVLVYDYWLLMLPIIIMFFYLIGVVILTCKILLNKTLAELNNLEEPVKGRGILLEKVSFIWNNMSFSQKVTMRNVFRFKGRMFVMISIVTGCVATIIASLGFRESVNNINTQYENIPYYDNLAYYIRSISEGTMDNIVDVFRDYIGGLTLVIMGLVIALTFIVMLNLISNNITKRTKEITTLEILGYHPHEIAYYMFKENLVLTIIGMATGVPFGIVLHSFMISQIYIDILHFQVTMNSIGFIIGLLATFTLFLTVSLILRRKYDIIGRA
jgi:putative ABC transport system permease protein